MCASAPTDVPRNENSQPRPFARVRSSQLGAENKDFDRDRLGRSAGGFVKNDKVLVLASRDALAAAPLHFGNEGGLACNFPLIPAQAGIQSAIIGPRISALGPRFRGDERIEGMPDTAAENRKNKNPQRFPAGGCSSRNRRYDVMGCIGRGSRIRTCDLLVPNQTRYQTALCPAGAGVRYMLRISRASKP